MSKSKLQKERTAAKRALWARLARPAVLDAFHRAVRFSKDGTLSFRTIESMALDYSIGETRMFPECEILDDPVRGPLVEVRAAVEQLVVSGNIREVTDPIALVANAEHQKYSRAIRQIRRFVFQYGDTDGDTVDMHADPSVSDAYSSEDQE